MAERRKLPPAPIAKATEARPLAPSHARRFALPAVATLLAAMAVTACSAANEDDGAVADDHPRHVLASNTTTIVDTTPAPTVAATIDPTATIEVDGTSTNVKPPPPAPTAPTVAATTGYGLGGPPPSMPPGAAGGMRPVSPPVPSVKPPKMAGKVAAVHPTT